jgi:hypothetical protein
VRAWQSAAPPPTHGQAPPGFALSESPRYIGRAIVSLALDPNRQRWNQQSVSSSELARVHGFTDVDGTSPDIWQHMEDSENVD